MLSKQKSFPLRWLTSIRFSRNLLSSPPLGGAGWGVRKGGKLDLFCEQLHSLNQKRYGNVIETKYFPNIHWWWSLSLYTFIVTCRSCPLVAGIGGKWAVSANTSTALTKIVGEMLSKQKRLPVYQWWYLLLFIFSSLASLPQKKICRNLQKKISRERIFALVLGATGDPTIETKVIRSSIPKCLVNLVVPVESTLEDFVLYIVWILLMTFPIFSESTNFTLCNL